MFCRRAYIAGGHVLLEGMCCWRKCGSGGHVFHENVLWKDMPCMRTCLMGGHV